MASSIGIPAEEQVLNLINRIMEDEKISSWSCSCRFPVSGAEEGTDNLQKPKEPPYEIRLMVSKKTDKSSIFISMMKSFIAKMIAAFGLFVLSVLSVWLLSHYVKGPSCVKEMHSGNPYVTSNIVWSVVTHN